MDRITTTKRHLVADELPPEAHVGPRHWPTSLQPPVGLQQTRAPVLQQVSDAHGGGAAHAGVAMHQGATTGSCGHLDLIRHLVEMITEGR